MIFPITDRSQMMKEVKLTISSIKSRVKKKKIFFNKCVWNSQRCSYVIWKNELLRQRRDLLFDFAVPEEDGAETSFTWPRDEIIFYRDTRRIKCIRFLSHHWCMSSERMKNLITYIVVLYMAHISTLLVSYEKCVN